MTMELCKVFRETHQYCIPNILFNVFYLLFPFPEINLKEDCYCKTLYRPFSYNLSPLYQYVSIIPCIHKHSVTNVEEKLCTHYDRQVNKMKSIPHGTHSCPKPFTCRILICLTIVDFPDSPAPRNKQKKKSYYGPYHRSMWVRSGRNHTRKKAVFCFKNEIPT